jgi:hypothetical protein
MKRSIWLWALCGVLAAAPAFCQQPGDERPGPRPQQAPGMEQRLQQLGLQEREAEIEFQRKMREFELKKRELELARQAKALELQAAGDGHRHGDRGAMGLVVLLCLVIHILVSIWVYQDLRRRNAGSAIWVVIALLSGLFGALVYAVVRLGDNKKEG